MILLLRQASVTRTIWPTQVVSPSNTLTSVHERSERRTNVSQYVQFGAILITVPNLIVIVTMIVVFALGLWLKLPSHRDE